jgi:hypothetical protein
MSATTSCATDALRDPSQPVDVDAWAGAGTANAKQPKSATIEPRKFLTM